jgi:hypothetical protein
VSEYREHGATTLTREARSLWHDPPPAPVPPPAPRCPSGERCRACGYRKDAPGHEFTCGDTQG